MLSCEKKGKFVEAEITKQRINQIRKIEVNKIIEEVKCNFQKKTELLQFEQKFELDNLNNLFDNELQKFTLKFNNLVIEITKEMTSKLKNNDDEFNKCVKVNPSAEILNLNIILTSLLKFKNYEKAHHIQTQINKLNQEESEKSSHNINNKKLKEQAKFKSKYEQDLLSLCLKKTQAYNEIKKKRALELDNLIQKHKNKLKELDLSLKNEINEVVKIKNQNYFGSMVSTRLQNKQGSKHGSSVSLEIDIQKSFRITAGSHMNSKKTIKNIKINS